MRFEAKTDYNKSASVDGGRLHIVQFFPSSSYYFNFLFIEIVNNGIMHYEAINVQKQLFHLKIFIEIDSSGTFRLMNYDTCFPDLSAAKPEAYHLFIREKNKTN